MTIPTYDENRCYSMDFVDLKKHKCVEFHDSTMDDIIAVLLELGFIDDDGEENRADVISKVLALDKALETRITK